MSRARGQSGPTISLFPFLAVLLCTMGSLLVVLVIFSRSAKQAGAAAAEELRRKAAAEEQARREELELAREEFGWRISQVREVRDRTADDLAKARMRLAGTEEDARTLADRLDALARVAEALQQRPADAAERETVLDLERRLAEARKALEEVKDAAAEKPPAYAVVPYEGPNGTHRRPLYIECCIDGVFLQPEGIRLGPADFEGPPGPGNPLASALRAAREHVARSPGESGDPSVQPYPLLLVRPSGVMAYYAARESIQSWGSEFGYQFIDEEWTLNYPPRDPALAEVEMRAVEEARRRLEWLAQVRPAKPPRPTTQYRAATTRGGVVSNGGPSVLGDQSRFDWTEEQAGTARGGPGRGFNPSAAATGDGGDAALADGTAAGGDVILGNRGGRGAGPGGSGSGKGRTPGAAGGEGGEGGDGSGPADAAVVGNRYAGPSRFYAGSGGGDGRGGASTGEPGGVDGGGQGGVAGGQAAAGGTSAGTASGVATSGAGGQPGAGSPGGGGSSGGSQGMASAAGGGGGGSGPSMPGLHQAGGGAAAGGVGGSAGASASLAGKRGSNWASLATQENPVPLTRPIKLECAADEFRILGDSGRVATRIPIGTHTVDSVDPLVREVHAAVARWGLAGDRMYWKPELVLSATPDGAARRDDLERLLADSGIDTRRSESRDKVRNLPPVQRTGGLFPRR